jgi:hypothetical protein
VAERESETERDREKRKKEGRDGGREDKQRFVNKVGNTLAL